MSLARRRQVVDIAREARVTIIEDDAYGRLPIAPLPALAALAPDLTWYVATLSKCLSPGQWSGRSIQRWMPSGAP